MTVKFEVKMTDQAMYDFLLYHNYTHASGLLGAMLGVVCLGLAINNGINGQISSACILGLMAFIMICMEPINLKQTAKRQVKTTEMFQEPLRYEMTEEGLTVEQNGQSETNSWDNFMKVVSTNKSIIMYVTRVRAIILPKESLGSDYIQAVKMISTHMPAKKVKIRHAK